MRTLTAGTSLVTGLAMTRLGLRTFWLRYAALGGSCAPHELVGYLDGELEWPAPEHDVAAHALNEYCAEMGLGHPVAYADEV
jgi:hypothetical protein